jgi:hypothetical protein
MHAYERAGLPQIPDSKSESEIKRTQATLEPTAESGRNSSATRPAVGEPANKAQPNVVACMLQFIDGVDEMRVEHTQAADDSQTVEADDHKRAETADYLAWKSAGRPSCQQCLKSHPPPCKSSQEDIDFCQRDPEGYKLYLKSIKPPRKQKPRSNRRPGHNTSQSSRPAQTHRVDTHAAHANTPARRQATTPPSPFLVAFMREAAVYAAANDPAATRAVLAPNDTHSHSQQESRRALSRVFEDALAQLATDAAEQTQQ